MVESGIMIAQVKDLKKGKYVVIDGVPCRVVDVEVSKTGKHGSHKARVTAIGVFTDAKKVLLKPVDSDCEIPVVNRRKGQIIADLGNNIQIMDLQSYETFEMPKPEGMAVAPGSEVEYLEAMGVRGIVRTKGED
jgi:translation initiation factor 5A